MSNPENARKPVQFVRSLLSLREKFSRIVTQSFEGDQRFQKTLKDSFVDFINEDCKTAQFLSLFLDELLKSGARSLKEQECEQKLDEAVVLFRFVTS